MLIRNLFPKIFISGGITYFKDLSKNQILQIKPMIDVEISCVEEDWSLNSEIKNKNDFFPDGLLSSRNFYDSNRMTFVAMKDGYIVHYSSVNLHNPNRVMIGDNHTLSEYRSKHIGSAVLVYIMRYLKNRGVCRVFISTASWNKSSQRMILNAGFKVERRFADIIIQDNPKWLIKLKGFLKNSFLKTTMENVAYGIITLFDMRNDKKSRL